MAKYDVYKASGFQGYLLDIQCDLLAGLNTRVVVPLMSIQSAPIPAERLNPIFTIKTKQYVIRNGDSVFILDPDFYSKDTGW